MQEEMQREKVEQGDGNEITVNLAEIMSYLLHKWWIWLLCLVLGTLVGAIVGNTQKTTVYQSNATYLVYYDGGGSSLSETTSEQSKVASLLAGCTTLVNQNKFYEAVMAAYNQNNSNEQISNYTTIGKSLSVRYSTADGNVIYVTVKHADKHLCYGIMQAFTDTFKDYIKENYNKAGDLLAFSLANNIAQENDPLWTPIVESAVVKSAIFGGGGAFVLSVIVLVVIVLADTRVRGEEDLTSKYGLPVLASIPDLADKELSKGGYYREYKYEA